MQQFVWDEVLSVNICLDTRLRDQSPSFKVLPSPKELYLWFVGGGWGLVQIYTALPYY